MTTQTTFQGAKQHDGFSADGNEESVTIITPTFPTSELSEALRSGVDKGNNFKRNTPQTTPSQWRGLFQTIHEYFYPPEGEKMRRLLRYSVLGGGGISTFSRGKILNAWWQL